MKLSAMAGPFVCLKEARTQPWPIVVRVKSDTELKIGAGQSKSV